MIPPRTILGVGCNPARMAAGNETLKRHGFNVVTATSVPAALAACAGIDVDAVVIGRSIPENSAQTLICRLRQRGGPPVMYLAESDNDSLRVSADQQQFLNQQFLRMLRTILVRNRSDENAVDSEIGSNLRILCAWWLASPVALATVGIIVAADGDAGFLEGMGFYVGIAACIVCAVGGLRSQLQALDVMRTYGINTDPGTPGSLWESLFAPWHPRGGRGLSSFHAKTASPESGKSLNGAAPHRHATDTGCPPRASLSSL